jgi:hypothetical protein
MRDEEDVNKINDKKYLVPREILDITITLDQLDDALDIVNLDNSSTDDESMEIIITHILQTACKKNEMISNKDINERIGKLRVDRLAQLLSKSGLAEFTIDENGETIGFITQKGKELVNGN